MAILNCNWFFVNGIQTDTTRGKVTRRSYQAMLEQELPSLIKQQGTIFMHDNASIHTAHKVGDYLQETTYNVMS